MKTCCLAVSFALAATTAFAQHGDLELVDDGGQVGVEPRVAEGEFGEVPLPAFRATEPGLESDPEELLLEGETPLPGGAAVGFDLVAFTIDSTNRGLFYWDGVGSVDFVSVASPHQLKVSDATLSLSVQTDGASDVAGFNFDVTADGSGPDVAGFVHHDLIFDLVDASGTGVGAPMAGLYTFATTFRVAGLTDSEPVYWVLGAGVGEDVHEAAVNYVARSQGLVPEPSSFMLIGLASFCSLSFGRRRS